jgi:hypothetical protein
VLCAEVNGCCESGPVLIGAEGVANVDLAGAALARARAEELPLSEMMSRCSLAASACGTKRQ